MHPTNEIHEYLAKRFREWRRRYNLSLAEISAITDIPVRTLEGIEQGRGFRYPGLFVNALLGVTSAGRLLADGNGIRVSIQTAEDILLAVEERGDDEPAADAGTGGKGTGDRRGHAGGNPKGRRAPVHQHRPRKEARDAALRSGRSAGLEGKE